MYHMTTTQRRMVCANVVTVLVAILASCGADGGDSQEAAPTTLATTSTTLTPQQQMANWLAGARGDISTIRRVIVTMQNRPTGEPYLAACRDLGAAAASLKARMPAPDPVFASRAQALLEVFIFDAQLCPAHSGRLGLEDSTYDSVQKYGVEFSLLVQRAGGPSG